MMYVTRKAHFSAAHRLFNPFFSEEKNIEVYDKCANANGHGHNYYLEITVAGEPDPQTGYIIDLKKLKKIIEDYFISKVDHKHLNYDVEFLKGVVPTAENIAVACWNQLVAQIHEGHLYSVKLFETQNNFVEYKGGE